MDGQCPEFQSGLETHGFKRNSKVTVRLSSLFLLFMSSEHTHVADANSVQHVSDIGVCYVTQLSPTSA